MLARTLRNYLFPLGSLARQVAAQPPRRCKVHPETALRPPSVDPLRPAGLAVTFMAGAGHAGEDVDQRRRANLSPRPSTCFPHHGAMRLTREGEHPLVPFTVVGVSGRRQPMARPRVSCLEPWQNGPPRTAAPVTRGLFPSLEGSSRGAYRSPSAAGRRATRAHGPLCTAGLYARLWERGVRCRPPPHRW